MKIVKGVGERLLPRWLADELRPILAFTGAGAALWAGSCELVRRGWNALGEHLNGWERLGALPAAGYALTYACWHAPHIARFAVPFAGLAWCVAALCVSPLAIEETVEVQPAADDTPALALAELAAIVRRVAGPRQGAHLADLLSEPELAGWTQPELKANAIHFELPVEEFKLILAGRQRVRDGIRLRDLPPEPAVEAPPRPLFAPAAGPE